MATNKPVLLNLGKGVSLMIGLTTISSWTNSGKRPKDPKKGTLGFNSQTNNLEYWDGSDWFAASMSSL